MAELGDEPPEQVLIEGVVIGDEDAQRAGLDLLRRRLFSATSGDLDQHVVQRARRDRLGQRGLDDAAVRGRRLGGSRHRRRDQDDGHLVGSPEIAERR